ncbi:superoxide dismutase family protein [Alienimonas sp. DA493]|uniref:superoxide dismutase family protein n=1 Tax=Alienimonas sp. DA493 TaxID=3373605 RepID=UPI0037540D6E
MHRRLFLPAVALSAAGLTAAGTLAGPTTQAATASAASRTVAEPVVTKAVAVLMPVGDSGVSGTLYFERVDDSKVKVTGEVKGLKPGEHGFHVHQFGDLTDTETGKSAGGHMDVGEHKHGRPSDEERHTGDLGNITANEDGVAKVNITDEVISLNGAHSVVGRGFIVHADPDDFGQPTGNAGARVAIGVIGVAQDGLK